MWPTGSASGQHPAPGRLTGPALGWPSTRPDQALASPWGTRPCRMAPGPGRPRSPGDPCRRPRPWSIPTGPRSCAGPSSGCTSRWYRSCRARCTWRRGAAPRPAHPRARVSVLNAGIARSVGIGPGGLVAAGGGVRGVARVDVGFVEGDDDQGVTALVGGGVEDHRHPGLEELIGPGQAAGVATGAVGARRRSGRGRRCTGWG